MAEPAAADVPPESPWRTFVTLGRDRWSGQLTIVADDRRFSVTFHDGVVVAASSPLATDAAVRVALLGQLVSSTQVSTIVRRMAGAPQRQELELIAELARLSPDQTILLHRRINARCAARAFALDHGAILMDPQVTTAAAVDTAVDVREVAFVAARENMSEERLDAELARAGAYFVLRADAAADLPRFGFPDAAQPVVERLRAGATLAELLACRPGIEHRLVCAVVYALAVVDACEGLAKPPVRAGEDLAVPVAAPVPAVATPSPAVAATERERIDTAVESPVVIADRMKISEALAEGNLPAPHAVQDVVDVVAPVTRPRRPFRYTPDDDELAPVGRGERPSIPTIETIQIDGTLEVAELEPVPVRTPQKQAPRDLVGVTIADRYVIEQKLGVGPLGVVYRAHHTKLTRLFAIKLLHRGLLANMASVQRFGREAALAGALRHLNVVGVVDVGIHDGVPFLAMDHADGVPLSSLLGAPMPPARAIGLLRQLCAGLGHAHDQNLIHRDLKPDNVIVEMTLDEEIPRIADFGTAILRDNGNAERLTAAGVVLGTPAYMAPEQALARAIDHRIDLYALGILAYQMVTGVLPFTGSGVDIAVANCQQPTPVMNVRVPGLVVDARLEALVRSLLEKDPKARPADAHAVRRALEALDLELAREKSTAVVEPVAPVVEPVAPVVEPVAPVTEPEPARSETATKAMWKFEKLAAPAAVAEPVSTVVAPAPVVMPPVLPPVLPVVVPPPVATRLVAPERRRKELTTEELPAARATWPTFVIVAGVAFVAIVAVIALSRAGHDDREDAAAPAPAGAAQLLATSFATHYDAVDRDLQALRKRLGASATSVVWARFGAIHVDAANATPEARSQADAELDAIQREMASLRGQ